MRNLSAKWVLFAIVASSLVFISPTFARPIFAISKSSGSNSSIRDTHTNSSTTVSSATATHNQLKGVKINRVHTNPPTVAVGRTFTILGIVFNNSSGVITFANGTCNSPVSIDFNKNVIVENQGAASCAAPTPEVVLKPGEQSLILSPNLSGIAYKATAPGMTNATISFNYGIETAKGKSPISDSILKVYTFNIHPFPQVTSSHPGHQTPTAASCPTSVAPIGSGSGRSHSLLSIKYPKKNAMVPAGCLLAVTGTSAPSNATHTNCNVGVRINLHGFMQASPQGPKGAGDYTKWTAITSNPTQQGPNLIEAQLLCFPPGKVSTPNLIKHLVHNVTGIQVVGMPTPAVSPPSSPPLKQTAPIPKKVSLG